MNLHQLCFDLEQRYLIRALPVRITGSRWAFAGPSAPQDLPITACHRIRIDDTQGIIFYGWYDLSSDDHRLIEQRVRSLQ